MTFPVLKNLLAPALFAIAFLLSGCASADFKPYVGQQEEWQTAPGTFMDTKYAVPVYYGPPSRPYIILGYLDAKTAAVRRNGVVAFAARRAKELGGDALVVLVQGSEYAGTISNGSSQTSGYYEGNYSHGYTSGTLDATTTSSSASIPLYRGTATAMVIRFK